MTATEPPRKVSVCIHGLFPDYPEAIPERVTERIRSQIDVFLDDQRLVAWLGQVDWADVSIWAGELVAFERERLTLDTERHAYDWGVIERALEWSTIYISREALLNEPTEETAAKVTAALAYVLAAYAREEGKDNIASWLERELIADDAAEFIEQLEAGSDLLDDEEERPVLVLAFPTSGSSPFGTKEDLELRQEMQRALDDFFEREGGGEVEGGQIGAGSMEIFVVVDDPNSMKPRILEFLAERGYPQPTRFFVEDDN